MKDLKAYTLDADKITALADRNDMSVAEVIELMCEFIDLVCKEYHLKQFDWEV